MDAVPPQTRYEVEYIGSEEMQNAARALTATQVPLRNLYYGYVTRDPRSRPQYRRMVVSESKLRILYKDSSGVLANTAHPITTITFAAAVRFACKYGEGRKLYGAFEPLGKETADDDCASDLFDVLGKRFELLTSFNHPPLFTCIMRRWDRSKVIECHAFVCSRESDALNIVRALGQAQKNYKNHIIERIVREKWSFLREKTRDARKCDFTSTVIGFPQCNEVTDADSLRSRITYLAAETLQEKLSSCRPALYRGPTPTTAKHETGQFWKDGRRKWIERKMVEKAKSKREASLIDKDVDDVDNFVLKATCHNHRVYDSPRPLNFLAKYLPGLENEDEHQAYEYKISMFSQTPASQTSEDPRLKPDLNQRQETVANELEYQLTKAPTGGVKLYPFFDPEEVINRPNLPASKTSSNKIGHDCLYAKVKKPTIGRGIHAINELIKKRYNSKNHEPRGPDPDSANLCNWSYGSGNSTEHQCLTMDTVSGEVDVEAVSSSYSSQTEAVDMHVKDGTSAMENHKGLNGSPGSTASSSKTETFFDALGYLP